MKGNAADQLDIEVPHAEGPEGGLPDNSECLGENIVQSLPPLDPFAEFGCLSFKFRIA